MSEKSFAVVTPPLVAALVKADDVLGPNREWTPVNEVQEAFLDFVKTDRDTVLNLKEIESVASRHAKDINTFLEKRGFSIKIEEMGANEFATASILDILFKWLEKGKKASILYQEEVYPAVKLECFRLLENRSNGQLVVEIDTQTDDKLYLTMCDSPQTGLDLIRQVESLDLKPALDTYDELLFPMIDLEHTENHEWMRGLSANDERGTPWSVSKCLQQTKLRMNEMGGRCQSAAVILMKGFSASLKKQYIINKPFLCWYRRKDLSHPLFAAFLAPDCWRKPRDLK